MAGCLAIQMVDCLVERMVADLAALSADKKALPMVELWANYLVELLVACSAGLMVVELVDQKVDWMVKKMAVE